MNITCSNLAGSDESEFSGVWTSLFEPHSLVDFQLGSRPGDIDLDGDIDLGDLTALLASFGTCESDAAYNAIADSNGSGCVDLTDLTTLLAGFGS